MTYTFKISRRLARIRTLAVVALPVLALASCAPGEPLEDGFSPPPAGEIIAVILSPDSTSIPLDGSATFVARGRQGDGTMVTPVPVVWEATGGNISAVGVYSAGNTPGRFRVVANHESGLADTSVVVIEAPVLTGITVSPAVVSLQAGQTQSFAAVASLSDGSTQSNPAVVWTATGGSITTAGSYTAGSTAGSFRVIATMQDRADTSAVTVIVPAATVASVSVAPGSVALQSGQTQQFTASATMSDGSTVPNAGVTWSATGGSVSGSGLYTAGSTAGTFRVVAMSANGRADTSSVTLTVPAATVNSIAMTPPSVALQSGQTQQFAVTATMSDGSSLPNPAVTWTATGGTVVAGLYTAGGTAGTFRVIATTANGRADTSSVTLTVPAATISSITMTPPSVALQSGQTQQFAVSASMSDGSSVLNPAVTWTATGGTVIAGLYTAGGTAGTFRVIATTANGRADTSSVTLTVPAATISSITMTPPSVALQSGQTQQFAVSASMSDGSSVPNPAVTWTATGGTVIAGLYTAGGTAGTFRVVATSANGRADTSAVTLTVPAATISSIVVTPPSVALQSGATQQFAASATLSDGSTQASPSVTWTATGGTVSTGGLYTAGGAAGTFRVVATSTNGRADTSTVTLSIPAVTIAALSLTPATVALQAGQTQQFAVSATMSDGSTQASPTVTWTATGGTISGSAVYTAGSTAGSYRVIVAASGKADTSTVSVSVPAPVLTDLTLTPGSITLVEGASQQMSVSGQWSDGSTSAPAVSYSATGGSITTNGVYSAGTTAGTFRVVAVQQGGTQADTSAVTITEPVTPPPGGVNPNEPAGYTQISNQAFNSLTADSWIVDGGSPSLATDATAPVSPSGVVRANYPAGFHGGSGPWTLERSLPGGRTRLYINLAFKLSANFQGEPSGTNKMAFTWMHNNPAIFLSNEGVGSGNLVATVRLQGVPDARGNGNGLPPNTGRSAVVSRGVWHTWEVEMISNTGGSANGIVRWWLDGVLVGEHTDVNMASSGQSRTFEVASIYPIWGGTNGVVSSAMSIDFDNIYISGSN